MALLTLLAGVTLLVGGGALMVRGASELAARYRVSPMVVGLTLVSFGTSAPELVVSVLSATPAADGLAFGNVLGSNIANLALVLGVAAVVSPIVLQGQLVRREIPYLLLMTTIVGVVALDEFTVGRPSVIDRADATVLLLLFCIFLYMNVVDISRSRSTDALLDNVVSNPFIVTEQSTRLMWVQVVGGGALLCFGGELAVSNAIKLASGLGVSATIVGLFVVAIGTSAPELVTSVIAALRRESDLAVGNVVGSNIFNAMFVLPIAALFRPIPLPVGGALDLGVAWVLVALLVPIFFLGKAKLNRPTAVGLLLIFIIYAVVRTSAV